MPDQVARARAQDLLDSIFRVATELVRGERASLMLRADGSSDFVIARAIGIAEEVQRQVRVREGEGVAGRVAASKRGILRRGGGRGELDSPGDYRTHSFVSVPIVVGDELRGVLNVADPVDANGFGDADLETLELLAGHIGACLVQQEQDEALQSLADTDPLTWLFNRRHFDRRLEAEADRAMRSQHLLALLLMDLDGFKGVNDRFGHRVGDQVLKAVAGAIRVAIRRYDVPTRYGGDEFAVILPEADTEAASTVARRVLQAVAAAPLPPALMMSGERIGLSIGVATFPRPATGTAALIESADGAMYRAKAEGGGVRVWEHAIAEGPRGRIRYAREEGLPAPYLAEPARLATSELQRLIPFALASEWNALVVGREGQVLTVAMPAPDPAAVDAISKVSGYAIYPVYSNAQDLAATRGRLATAS